MTIAFTRAASGHRISATVLRTDLSSRQASYRRSPWATIFVIATRSRVN